MGSSPSLEPPVKPVVEITPEYGYVVLVLAASFIMNLYLTINVVLARKKYDVQYPALYAPESHKHAKAFNCVQRAHQNTLESWAPIMILMLVVGLCAPKPAAAFGGIWVASRFIYGYGYATGGPQGRMLGGGLGHLGDFPLIGLAFYHGAKMAKLI